jgi:hypothetical protein
MTARMTLYVVCRRCMCMTLYVCHCMLYVLMIAMALHIGDWALQRTAALFFEGTEDVSVQDCVLQRLDGNALMLSSYNARTSIVNNTFLYTGASTIALWGSTSGSHPDQPPGTGPDGTAGDFPRWTIVEGNYMRYLGIHEKQSSCVFSAKSAQTTIRRNLCFDVPRAGTYVVCMHVVCLLYV